MANFYISDTHFGHKAVIGFDNRPFENVEEMDRAMMNNWNEKVGDGDDIFIVGDFCHRSGYSPDYYLKRLKGHKHLIIGNHDRVILENERAVKCLETIEQIGYVKDGDREVYMCHFPMVEWNKSRHGTWHVFGHIHVRKNETYQTMKKLDHAVNAAAGINHYTPSTFEELIANNRAFEMDDEPEPVMIVMTNKLTGQSFRLNLSEYCSICKNSDNAILETDGSVLNIGLGDAKGIVVNPAYHIRPAEAADASLPVMRITRKV